MVNQSYRDMVSNTWTCQRNAYCNGCRYWKYFGGFYGCKRFGIYKLEEFDRLCGGRYKT